MDNLEYFKIKCYYLHIELIVINQLQLNKQRNYKETFLIKIFKGLEATSMHTF